MRQMQRRLVSLQENKANLAGYEYTQLQSGAKIWVFASLSDTKWSSHNLEYFDGTQFWRFTAQIHSFLLASKTGGNLP